MKIDIFPHITPKKFLDALEKQTSSRFPLRDVIMAASSLTDLEARFRIMDRYPDLVHVLTVSSPPLEVIAGPKEAVELARLANDEVAELVTKYPDRFVAGVAILPMNDIDAALEETDRVINELRFRGVQIFSNIDGKPLDSPELMPLYERMVHYNLPIWIHPRREPSFTDYSTENRSRYAIFSIFGWPYETTVAMARLVFSGVLEKYPELKFITHHAGAMVPYFAERIVGAYAFDESRVKVKFMRSLRRPPIDYFRMFYNDTALYGNTPALMCAHAFFGPERLLFGTDMPYDSQLGDRHTRETIRAIDAMDIPEADKKMIYEDNARRLLRLPV
ncbi:MAG: amidohydrolase family protein, partial [Dehalococcoidia bacterium]